MFVANVDEGLELRLFEPHHADALFRLTDQNRTYLREWLPWVADTHTPEDTKTFIRSGLTQYAEHDGFQAGIWHRGGLVGAVGLHHIRWATRRTEIGYWLAKDAQGQGIITRVCHYICRYAFTELNLNRVEIRCAAGNSRSRAVPERLGFVQEGVIRQSTETAHGLADMVVYGLLASEWRALDIT